MQRRECFSGCAYASEVNAVSARLNPITLTGWNQDVVLENAPFPAITADFDTFGSTWFGAGWRGHPDGLPSSLRFTSQFNPEVIFQLQPYTTNNALRLDTSFSGRTGTLVLAITSPYRSLAILGSSGTGRGTGTLALNFVDGTSVSNLSFVALDWYDFSTNLALAGFGRRDSALPPPGYGTAGTGFGFFETDIDLAALGLERKFLKSLTFNQMGLALGMYVTDYGAYPYFLQSSQTSSVYWKQSLERYYPLSWTNRGYHCPGYKGAVSMEGQNVVFPVGSYAYNFMGTAYPLAYTAVPWQSLPANDPVFFLGLGLEYDLRPEYGISTPAAIAESRVRNPADMFDIGESRLLPPPGQAGELVMRIGKGYGTPDYPLRHGKNYNQLCCDGHVEALAPSKLFDCSQTSTRWNNDNQPHAETWH